MGTLEDHKRDQVKAVGPHDRCDVDSKFSKDFFNTEKHTVSINGTETIMESQKWPTFSAQSAQFSYASSEFCSVVSAKCALENSDDPWDMTPRAWRGVLFRRGTIVTKRDSGEYFAALGLIGTLIVGLWKVKMVTLKKVGRNRGQTVFVIGSGSQGYINALPTWASPLDLDDYQGIPTKIISPLELWLQNGKKKITDHGVVWLKTGEPEEMIAMAALNCFYDMPKHQLNIFCVELDLQPTTPDLVGHLEILIHTILPDKSQEEVNEILEMRCEVPEDPIGDLVPDADVQGAMFPEEDSKHLKPPPLRGPNDYIGGYRAQLVRLPIAATHHPITKQFIN